MLASLLALNSKIASFFFKKLPLESFLYPSQPTRNAFQLDSKNTESSEPFSMLDFLWKHFLGGVEDDMWMKSHFIGATYNPPDFHDILWKTRRRKKGRKTFLRNFPFHPSQVPFGYRLTVKDDNSIIFYNAL